MHKSVGAFVDMHHISDSMCVFVNRTVANFDCVSKCDPKYFPPNQFFGACLSMHVITEHE